MRIRTKTCPECGEHFSYEIRKGADRKHCSAPCREKLKKRHALARAALLGPCAIEGCEGKATRKAQHCEKHYIRIRRTGVATPRHAEGRYTTGAGYIKLLDRMHPLSDSNGNVYEHRHVAYVEHKGQCPGCFWCGVELEWKTAVVDHLDEQKANNTPSNLVVSCNDCNRARGSLLPFLRRMRTEAFPVFVGQMQAYRALPT